MRNIIPNYPLDKFWCLASFGLALYVLNFALTFHNVWPTLAITTRHDISVEIAILIFCMSLYTWKFAMLSTRVITLLAGLLTLMTIARYIEVTAPALFGRRINLYWDAQYLPHVAEMMVQAASPAQVFLVFGGGMVALAGIFLALRTSLNRLAGALETGSTQRGLAAIMGILIVGYSMGHVDQPVHTLKYYSLPLTKTYWEQMEFISRVLANEADEVLPDSDPLGRFGLPGLQNNDIIVQFIESYGATAFDTPLIADRIAANRDDMVSAVSATGRRVVSGFITSPTFGGNSWLSHSSFMTGLDVRHLSTYELLVTQDRPTLSDRFAALGYRPVAFMPGLRTQWPEGRFYGFEKIYGERDLDYPGPEFGWWRIPDQFSLARIAQWELDKTSRQPLFLFFTTITPHMPFRPTPPYQPDWSRMISDQPYEPAAVKQSLAQRPEWTNLQPAYADTLAYTFTYLAGFLRSQPDRDFVWIIIGDHQPPASVSGQNVRWDVPVHIISRNHGIIDTLIRQGFVEGMVPDHQPINTMHQLPVTLLRIFSGS